jgi:hypothetical protein
MAREDRVGSGIAMADINVDLLEWNEKPFY